MMHARAQVTYQLRPAYAYADGRCTEFKADFGHVVLNAYKASTPGVHFRPMPSMPVFVHPSPLWSARNAVCIARAIRAAASDDAVMRAATALLA